MKSMYNIAFAQLKNGIEKNFNYCCLIIYEQLFLAEKTALLASKNQIKSNECLYWDIAKRLDADTDNCIRR